MRFSTYCWLAVEGSDDYDRTPRMRSWLWARDVNSEQENYASNIQLARMSPHKWIRLAAEAVVCGDGVIREFLERKTIEELLKAVYGIDEWLDLPDIAAYTRAGTYWEVSLPDYIEQRRFYGRTMHEIHGCTLAVVYKDGGRFRVVDPRDFQKLLDSREADRIDDEFEVLPGNDTLGTLNEALDEAMACLMDRLGVPAELYAGTAPSLSGRHVNAALPVRQHVSRSPQSNPVQALSADVLLPYAKADVEATTRLMVEILKIENPHRA